MSITGILVSVRERVIRVTRGQTMTEYALLLAAVAVAVYGAYRVLLLALWAGCRSNETNRYL